LNNARLRSLACSVNKILADEEYRYEKTMLLETTNTHAMQSLYQTLRTMRVPRMQIK
jgi:hypothetical protein